MAKAKKAAAPASAKDISMKTADKSVEGLRALASEFKGPMTGVVQKPDNLGEKMPLPPSAKVKKKR